MARRPRPQARKGRSDVTSASTKGDGWWHECVVMHGTMSIFAVKPRNFERCVVNVAARPYAKSRQIRPLRNARLTQTRTCHPIYRARDLVALEAIADNRERATDTMGDTSFVSFAKSRPVLSASCL